MKYFSKFLVIASLVVCGLVTVLVGIDSVTRTSHREEIRVTSIEEFTSYDSSIYVLEGVGVESNLLFSIDLDKQEYRILKNRFKASDTLLIPIRYDAGVFNFHVNSMLDGKKNNTE